MGVFPQNNEKNTPLVFPSRARYVGVFLWVHIWPHFCVQYRVIFDCNMSRIYDDDDDDDDDDVDNDGDNDGDMASLWISMIEL